MHGLQHYYKHQKLLATPGPSTTRLIGRAGSYFRAQHVVVSSLGLHTRNSVPKDGSNETTRHVLLHSLSPVPLPNQVQHTTFAHRTHSSFLFISQMTDHTQLSKHSMHSRIRHIIAQATTRYARLQGSAIYCDKDRSCKGSGFN